MSNNILWKGVLIEESLSDASILSKIRIVDTQSTSLEGEDFKGAFHFHSVEVTDENLQVVIDFISKHFKGPSWYFHLVKDSTMIVMFPNKVMRAHKENSEEIEAIRQYGISQGILEEQLGLEKLFENPFA